MDILNSSDRATEKNILAELEQEEPELAEQVRSSMFVFRRYRHLGQCFHPENSQGSGHQGSGTGSQDLFRGSGRGYIQKYVQAGSPDTQGKISNLWALYAW